MCAYKLNLITHTTSIYQMCLYVCWRWLLVCVSVCVCANAFHHALYNSSCSLHDRTKLQWLQFNMLDVLFARLFFRSSLQMYSLHSFVHSFIEFASPSHSFSLSHFECLCVWILIFLHSSEELNLLNTHTQVYTRQNTHWMQS